MQRFEEMIDRLLWEIEFTKLNPRETLPRNRHITPRYFSNATPFIPDLTKTMGDDPTEIDYMPPEEVSPVDFDEPIDYCVVIEHQLGGGADYQLSRIRPVSRKWWRGKCRPGRWIGELSVMYVVGEREYSVHRFGVTWRNEWFDEWGNPAGKRNFAHGMASMCSILVSAQLTDFYNWTVELGIEGGDFSLRLPTDPTGARAIFKLRDIPDGKQRRAALKHWVREHLRRNRNNPEELIAVRKHLRGAQEFSWNGMKCILRPSRYDLKVNG